VSDRDRAAGDGTASGRKSADAEFEALLSRALRIDVPTDLPEQKGGPRRGQWRWLAAAAVVVLAVGASVRGLQYYGYLPTGDLAGDVVAHIHHEPDAIRVQVASAGSALPTADVEAVVLAGGAHLEHLQPMVRYARLCPFRGETVAHLVVQGEAGPVTVPVDEDGFVGTIAPLESGGSIAVIGEPGESLTEIQNEVAAAVRWRL
jgi:hypothetical protein